MNLQSITNVSKMYDISTRTLRYYEQIGLIKSVKVEDYAYRMYDQETLTRLRQIIILRKLRIPLKQIGIILNSRNGQKTIRIFEESIENIEEEVAALETIKTSLRTFINEIEKVIPKPISADVFESTEVIDLIQSLSMQTLQLKEKISMKELNQANEIVERVKDMRIIYLPPMWVAACHQTGTNQEDEVNRQIGEFIAAKGLTELKPDFRRMGFNNPAADQQGSLGYEAWVTIPEDMDVEPPLVKKEFKGGVYAAKMIPFGEFQEWGNLWQWVMTNQEYDMDYVSRVVPADPKADLCLEEVLNAIHHLNDETPAGTQLDLLIPVTQKSNRLICQSCGMHIDDDKMKGTNADGSLSTDYCSFCFRDGKFTMERTIDEQVEIGLNYSEEYQNAANPDEQALIRKQTRRYLANLKRWKQQAAEDSAK